MQTVDRAKLVERAAAVGMISTGITSLAGIFVAEGLNITISVLVGLLLIGMEVVGVHRKAVAQIKQLGLGKVLTVLAILLPLGACVGLAFVNVLPGVILAFAAGLPADDLIALGIAGLAALANLVVLGGNAAQLLRGRTIPDRPMP